MNLLISLILRIASGEKLERGSLQNTAWWLGGLAVIPVGIILCTILIRELEQKVDIALLNSYVGIFVAVILIAIVMSALLIPCVRIFQKSPLWLILVAVVTWSGGAWLAYHEKAKQVIAPNPTLPLALESISTARGSEDS